MLWQQGPNLTRESNIYDILNMFTGLMDVCQHQKAESMLVTRDVDDRPVCHGGEKVVAELWYKDTSRR
jgi:hypothetical protein